MRKLLTLAAVAALAATQAQAVTPLWMRYAAISPNGQEIAFCYKGDIYKVAVTGGNAIQLTTQSSYEMNPVWSPDGRYLAFASDRKGNFDVFIMPSTGGAPTRLTTNSASELPWAFSPDGKYIYFSAAIQDPASSVSFPSGRLTEVYKVPVGGGRTTQVLGTPAEELKWDSKGKFMVYQDQKGMEDAWRKHHTSSVTREIWKYDANTGKHTNLTKAAVKVTSIAISGVQTKGKYTVASYDGSNNPVGKTVSGAVWLDPRKTSPFEFYQYWRNVGDADVLKCLRMLTFLPLEQIDDMDKWEGSQLNTAKEILAYELTKLVHGQEEADKAQESARALFSSGIAADMPETVLNESDLRDGKIDLIGILTASGLCKSRSDARRSIEQGGVSVNGEKITDIKKDYEPEQIQKEDFILRKGKKNYRKIKFQ